MNYNLPQRKDIRLKYYDYSLEGYYFITICTKNKQNILSKIICRGEHCSPVFMFAGAIVNKYISKIKEVYLNILIDEYIIMPNHIHMILIINKKE